MTATFNNALLSLILPQQCRVCRDQVENFEDGVACSACWNRTRIFNGKEMLCKKCGAFFGEKAAPVEVSCHKCDDHFYDKAFAAGVYENALAASVIELKATPVVGKRLRKTLADAWLSRGIDVDLIIPIPLSRRRTHERGYNQAEIIARELGKVSKTKVDAVSLSRKTHTPIHRVAMDDKARDLSVKNAFEVVRPQMVSGRRILLVDDVLTSGSTASYCAKVLKRNGALSVDVFTLARAVMQR